MHSLARLAVAALLCAGAAEAGWDDLLKSVGMDRAQVVTLEGSSPEAAAAGVKAGEGRVKVRSVVDVFNERLQIVWEREAEVAVYEMPPEAKVFAREKWSGAPLAAGWKKDGKAVVWTATPIGEAGYERYPYLLQAVESLGVKPRAEARDLWAFFDSSYRLRADPDYLAAMWRRGGVAGLHVAAWQYWEPDAGRDAWLKAVIEACHRQAIAVYAWIEFPHVSEKFWNDHPQWREKTASGQDAHLDWRKLMNLADKDCDAAIAAGLDNLVGRFDWDGLNLGELYFESLEGYLNPARFTPFHPQIRSRFKAEAGFDPAAMYDASSPQHHLKTAAPMRKFLEFRARLAHELQIQWLARLAKYREAKPGLDLVLTHIDDRFDTTMRDKLGADAAALIPEAEAVSATFLIEDPATIWHLGPGRYTEIGRRYRPLAKRPELLAIDINIVERYQDVYPAKQQTGGELFLLVRRAAEAFPRVALYFENSILGPDWGMLAASAAGGLELENLEGGGLRVKTPRTAVVRWKGCAAVNGVEWPAGGEESLILPEGTSEVRPCTGRAVRPVADFNGRLLGIEKTAQGWRLNYESRTRAFIKMAGPDGKAGEARALKAGRGSYEIRRAN